jgi:catechol 2,3-dioxygenase
MVLGLILMGACVGVGAQASAVGSKDIVDTALQPTCPPAYLPASLTGYLPHPCDFDNVTDVNRTSLEHEYGLAPPNYRLPARTRVGRARLQVSNLDRSIAYYRDVLGLRVLQSDVTTARLGPHGVDTVLLELHGRRGARAVPPAGLLGLYHFAILLPSRAALGRFVRHLIEHEVKFGSADHSVSEAIYLWDPDGLGIEVYADRPRDAWRGTGRELLMGTERLDLRSVTEAGGRETWTGMPPGTAKGHMHISVGNLAAARNFYHTALGLDTVVWSYPGALFMSAGGYHHHLGTNTWAAGAQPATDEDAKLLEWELLLPRPADVNQACESLRSAGYTVAHDGETGRALDPWGTRLRLRSANEKLTPVRTKN